jgi:hypothetical protein
VTRPVDHAVAWPVSAEPPPVLYVIACGSPVAGHVGELVRLAHRAGWDVAVITTPDGRKFVDVEALAQQTGYPVRSRFKNPHDPDVLPAADAIVVAPATVNTVNKWACGIADTLALGLLIEGHGLGLPIVAMPYTNTAMAAHPAFRESLVRLRSWGVRVLFGDHVMAMPPPGAGSEYAIYFPWQLPLAALGPPRSAAAWNGSGPGGQTVDLTVRNRRRHAAEPRWPAPPVAPRPAPAIVRR